MKFQLKYKRKNDERIVLVLKIFYALEQRSA
jgi:hypothetical protein